MRRLSEKNKTFARELHQTGDPVAAYREAYPKSRDWKTRAPLLAEDCRIREFIAGLDAGQDHPCGRSPNREPSGGTPHLTDDELTKLTDDELTKLTDDELTKKVYRDIINDEHADPKDKLRAADLLNKMNGVYNRDPDPRNPLQQLLAMFTREELVELDALICALEDDLDTDATDAG